MTLLTNNPFKTFDLPETFKLDRELLEQKYLNLQKNFHPDTAEAAEEHIFLEMSSVINTHYEILKEPVKRGEVLLKIWFGCTLDDLPQTKIKPLIVQVFELREKLDTPQKQEAIEEIEHIYQNTLIDLERRQTQPEKDDFMAKLAKLKYFYKLKEEANL